MPILTKLLVIKITYLLFRFSFFVLSLLYYNINPPEFMLSDGFNSELF